jgi:hypothetical protein
MRVARPEARRLPAPWSVVDSPSGYVVFDAGERRLAYVNFNASLDAGMNSEARTDDEVSIGTA